MTVDASKRETLGPGGLDPHIDVTLGGRTYDVVPTFGALVRIEQALGAGLGALLLRFLERRHGVTDTTRILYEGIVARLGNAAPDYEAVGALVVREGLDAVSPAAIDLLAAALRGLETFAAEKTDDGERVAAEGSVAP